MDLARQTTLPTDSDLVDFTGVIQGHVGQNTRQTFAVQRHRVLRNPKLQLECREFVVRDQFGNLYVVFTSKLMDGEVWAVTDWVGIEKWDGLRLVGPWKKFRAFDDAMLAALQDKAFVGFGRATLSILRARQAAAQPMVVCNEAGMPIPA